VLAEAWSMLDEREREVLADLSVFAGRFNLVGAEAVATRGTEADAVVNVLERLVQKSLVREQDGEFSTLGSIREFAAHQADRSKARNRLTAWLTQADIDLREFADARPNGAHQLDLEAVARDTTHEVSARVRAAYRWCQANLHTTARSLGIELLDSVLSLQLDDEERGLLKLLRGQWSRDSGNLEGARTDLKSALEIARACEWKVAEARALGALTVGSTSAVTIN
jgi:hypothetical protein